jgi:glycosyltransferase involved in cell wall biosynthesis
MSETVSVVIATYNRHEQCKRAIDSALKQTHPPLEVIVVDDGSSVPFEDDRVRVIRTPDNTKRMFGWASPGYVRTLGMKEAKGAYLAFLDDDDEWLPNKLALQLQACRETGACCSEALIGTGHYNPTNDYFLMMSQRFFEEIKDIVRRKGCSDLENGFPARFSHDLLSHHNLVITSSVLVKRDIMEKVGYMKTVPLGVEDYDCWLEVSKVTDFAFVSTPCLYYDATPSTNR